MFQDFKQTCQERWLEGSWELHVALVNLQPTFLLACIVLHLKAISVPGKFWTSVGEVEANLPERSDGPGLNGRGRKPKFLA